MNYHNITNNDMLNGAGLRTVLFVSGCCHYCKECQNPQTWDPNSGIKFDADAVNEILMNLAPKHIKGLTLSGGDPMYPENRNEILDLVKTCKTIYPNKDIWLYTGYKWEELVEAPVMSDIIEYCDVVVDGEFINELKDVNYPYCGSTNQRVIDVQKSLKEKRVILYNE